MTEDQCTKSEFSGWVNGKPESDATTVNANGQMTGSINAKGAVKFYGYDALSNLTGITDSAGNTVTYHYDALGLLTEIDAPDGTLEVRYEYNVDKEKTAQFDALNDRPRVQQGQHP